MYQDVPALVKDPSDTLFPLTKTNYDGAWSYSRRFPATETWSDPPLLFFFSSSFSVPPSSKHSKLNLQRPHTYKAILERLGRDPDYIVTDRFSLLFLA